jgi:hypothetical protein
LGIARECRQSTAPTEIKHHDSHSGGDTTLRAPVTSPNAVNIDDAVVDVPVRSARNLVAWGFKTYALT